MVEEENGRPFRLSRPPVTRVRLGLFFDREDLVGLSAASEFISQARSAFPSVTERLPLLGWAEDHNPADVLVKTTTTPSFPLVSMVSSSGDQELSFQADRFVLAWTFDESAGAYPGYDVLSAQLRTSFDEFASTLVAVGAPSLRVRQAQCFYLNTIRELPGPALATYLLSGEQRVSRRDLLDNRTYVGSRMRLPLNAALPAHLQAGVDAESDDATIFWLRVTVDNPEDEPIDPLDLAHQLLIDNFVALTPDWLIDEWNTMEER